MVVVVVVVAVQRGGGGTDRKNNNSVELKIKMKKQVEVQPTHAGHEEKRESERATEGNQKGSAGLSAGILTRPDDY